MAKKNTFRVFAKVITYCYADIPANSKEEAEQIAEDMDGGDFISTDDGGDWIVAPEDMPTENLNEI